MQTILLILCILAAVYFAYRFFLLRKSIRKTSSALREITGELSENRIVKLPVQDACLEELLEAINENLTAIRREHIVYEKNERLLKEQIENISHDLRTPLTAILGYLKLIDKEHFNETDAEYLAITIRRSETLQALITQFYELSRVTSHDFSIKKEPVDAARILREICLAYYAQLEAQQLATDFSLPEHEIRLLGDADALKRIFANLLQNALRYARSYIRVHVQKNNADGTISFFFENDILPEQMPADPGRLFDRFYMQEQSRSRGGTGLGLTISKTLAEHMGGSIEAACRTQDSETTFAVRVTFPCPYPAAASSLYL